MTIAETIQALVASPLAPFVGNVIGFALAGLMMLNTAKGAREKDKQLEAITAANFKMIQDANKKCDQRVADIEARCRQWVDALQARVDLLSKADHAEGGDARLK
jgi:hypothetical protein